jgi:hypothetical protein
LSRGVPVTWSVLLAEYPRPSGSESLGLMWRTWFVYVVALADNLADSRQVALRRAFGPSSISVFPSPGYFSSVRGRLRYLALTRMFRLPCEACLFGPCDTSQIDFEDVFSNVHTRVTLDGIEVRFLVEPRPCKNRRLVAFEGASVSCPYSFAILVLWNVLW